MTGSLCEGAGGREVVATCELRRDMEIKYYSSGQVIDWWREYTRGDRGESSGAPCGYPSATIREEPTADGLRINRRYTAWLHVERFFSRNFEWHHAKPLLLMGEPTECLGVFERWYAAHPLMVTAELGAGGSVCDDMIAKRLAEALDGYNTGAHKTKQRTMKAALNAIRRGDLKAWRPAGDQYRTTEYEILQWVENDQRRSKSEAA